MYTLCSIASSRGANTNQLLLLVRALRSLRILLSTLSPFHNTVRLSVFLRNMPHDVMIAFLQQAELVHGGVVPVLPTLRPSNANLPLSPSRIINHNNIKDKKPTNNYSNSTKM